MAASGQTSTKVLKSAGSILAMSDYGLDVWITNNPEDARKTVRSMAASLVNQAPNKIKAELKASIIAQRKVAKKAEAASQPARDDKGFDPRDGGKIGRQHPRGSP